MPVPVEDDACPVCGEDVADCEHAVERNRIREERILNKVEDDPHPDDCPIWVGEQCNCWVSKVEI